MGKSTHFFGLPLYGQVINCLTSQESFKSCITSTSTASSTSHVFSFYRTAISQNLVQMRCGASLQPDNADLTTNYFFKKTSDSKYYVYFCSDFKSVKILKF